MTRKRALGRGLDALIGARSRAQALREEVPITAEKEAAVDTTEAQEENTAIEAKSPIPKKSRKASSVPRKADKATEGSATTETAEDSAESNASVKSVAKENGMKPQKQVASEPDQERLIRVALGALSRGRFQPRREFDQQRLEDLAASIQSRGVMQPIVVRPIATESGHSRYEIIAGERRWRAAQLAGLSVIPAVVRELDDETALALALIENIQREDLNAVEESMALKRLMDEFSLTQQQVGDAVGRSRAQVANMLRLLALEPEVLGMLERRELDVGHARALLALKGTRQRHTARDVVAQGLTVRQTEALVRRMLKPKNKPAPSSADVSKLELRLGELLGAAVKIDHAASGKGKVLIKYSSLDELDGILEHIR